MCASIVGCDRSSHILFFSSSGNINVSLRGHLGSFSCAGLPYGKCGDAVPSWSADSFRKKKKNSSASCVRLRDETTKVDNKGIAD